MYKKRERDTKIDAYINMTKGNKYKINRRKLKKQHVRKKREKTKWVKRSKARLFS